MARRLAQSRYDRSEKGKAARARARAKWRETEKGRAYQRDRQRAYRQTEQGKANRRSEQTRYRATKRGKAARLRYNKSEKGRTSAVARQAKRMGLILNGKGLNARQWRSILRSYDYCCAYCGQAQTTKASLCVEHVIPLSKGGQHEAGNIVPSCRACNSKKSDNLVERPRPEAPFLRFAAFDKPVWDWIEAEQEQQDYTLLQRIRGKIEDEGVMPTKYLA